MNIHEFAALKPGDEVDNPMTGGHGTIVEVDDRGVLVCLAKTSSASFHYTAQSRAWVHWELVTPARDINT